VGREAGLVGVANTKFPGSAGNRILIVQPVARHFIGRAIPANVERILN
jgi:hypothetical protein